MLSAMKYKDFVWPNNPKTFEVEYKRTLRSYKLPFAGFKVQNLGQQHRIFKGDGEFSGPDAYESFRLLAKVYSDGTSGWLEHPIWPAAKVYFAKLKLKQEPREDYVSYSFEFWECDSSTGTSGFTPGEPDFERTVYIAARENDTLSSIASRNNTTISLMKKLNPQISETDILYAGRLVRIS